MRGRGPGQGCVGACTHARACRNGVSPLFVASYGGHVSCVEALIGSKADVQKCDNKGLSPVQAALSNDHADCIPNHSS